MTRGDRQEFSADPFCGRDVRWIHLLLLAAVLGIGAFFRFHHIVRESQYPDEFWSVYISTGRGFELFDLPTGKLFDPPPKAMMEGAPSWPHVWTGMGTAVHPPLYHIVLRWWMDFFGDGDRSTRTFSAVCSLAGIVVLFDIVRRGSGTWAALAAAAVMALAVTQVDLSQQTRSYTFWALLGLIACHAIVRIESRGAAPLLLAELCIAVVALLLTHYLSVGPLLGLAAYALFRLRGSDRRKTIAVMSASALFALLIWSPWLWQQRKLLTMSYGWMLENHPQTASPLTHALAMPAIHLYGDGEVVPAEIFGIAVIVYLLPLLLLRRRPQLLIWWSVILGMILLLTIRDAMKGTMLSQYPRYSFLAAPAICAIVAAPLPIRGWPKWLLPGAMLLSVAIAAVQRAQEGHFYTGDWRGFMREVDHAVPPNDPLVFCADSFWGSATFPYLALAHYAPDSRRPIMMLKDPADADALRQLQPYAQVWLIGPAVGKSASLWLPGWQSTGGIGMPKTAFAEKMVPIAPISPERSHPATQTPPP